MIILAKIEFKIQPAKTISDIYLFKKNLHTNFNGDGQRSVVATSKLAIINLHTVPHLYAMLSVYKSLIVCDPEIRQSPTTL